MRKLIVFNNMTVDGFFEGPNREIDWHNVNVEFNEYAVTQLDSVDMILFGRKTYELMAGYWPTPAAKTNDPVVAEWMNAMPKIVFSRTLKKAEWSNTRLIKGNLAAEIRKLKQQKGKDLIIFGSAALVSSFLRLGLIDEYRIMVNPIVLGRGRSLFSDIKKRVHLKLLKTRSFHSGNVLLCYKPIKKAEK